MEKHLETKQLRLISRWYKPKWFLPDYIEQLYDIEVIDDYEATGWTVTYKRLQSINKKGKVYIVELERGS